MSITGAFSRKYLARWLYAVGVLLLVLTGWLWWSKIALNPERVFWGMVEQSLQTKGVTMQSVQQAEGDTLTQNIQYSLGVVNKAISQTTIEQGEAKVFTEVIGTPDADYTQYVAIKSTRRDAYDRPFDFSRVVGVWAKSDESNPPKLLGQALLGLTLPIGAVPIPIGNLASDAREKLIEQIRHERVYETDFKKAKKETVDGRTYYTYEVKIQAIAYVHLMKSFAESVGLHELDELDPNTYMGAAPMIVEMRVDARSRHLVSAKLVGTEFQQLFAGYDIPVASDLPTEAISATDLQNRLDELQ